MKYIWIIEVENPTRNTFCCTKRVNCAVRCFGMGHTTQGDRSAFNAYGEDSTLQETKFVQFLVAPSLKSGATYLLTIV